MWVETQSSAIVGTGALWEVFGHEVVGAMIDRLVHHGEVISLKGDFCRLKDRGRVPAATQTDG